MEAYCVKCKQKREIKDAEAVFTAAGVPATRGVCAVCGTSVYRMGRTEAHEGLEPPKVKPRPKKVVPRKGKLVIVESPAKARTMSRFLGKKYKVMASIGHVRDLLRSQLSVDVENNFTPKYRVPNEKRPVVKELKAIAQTAEEVYLATDPDREGEAIAWHLMEAAEIDPQITRRVVFHEITKPAIEEAFAHPRSIDMKRVNAQQARRVMDRLVGYNLSPLLWRKVRGRLSAGRVQSVALRLIIEREREIEAFVPEEYWTIAAEFLPQGKKETFVANLLRIDQEEPVLDSEDVVRPVLADMEEAQYKVSSVKLGTRQRNPSAPFTTSTLQQDASRRLGFTARKTMQIAQQLYEGVDLEGNGRTGLITYMRTDSTNISPVAQKEARELILQKYGKAYLPEQPPQYKTKTRGAQEAHEAIRPTSVHRTPTSLRKQLSRDQYRLYSLIWQRFMASQMNPAIYDTVTINVIGKSQKHRYDLRATGSVLRFPGFLTVYKIAKEGDEEDGTKVPKDLEDGQKLKLEQLIPEQHFTTPPPRYSDATLVKALEENGIGRPSTYALILSTLRQRGYIRREGRRLVPTETGFIVNDLLVEHFPDILNVNFTASMEEKLDLIAQGEEDWVDVVRSFYTPFEKQLNKAREEMPEVKAEPEKVGRACPKCGHDLIIRWGRHGKFIGCSNFPTCRYTEPWLEKIGMTCPQCKEGEVVIRRTRKGRVFYGCSNYPACDFSSWTQPLPVPCPECGGILVNANKEHAKCLSCETQFRLDELPIPKVGESA